LVRAALLALVKLILADKNHQIVEGMEAQVCLALLSLLLAELVLAALLVV
jgi:hypothetical protein